MIICLIVLSKARNPRRGEDAHEISSAFGGQLSAIPLDGAGSLRLLDDLFGSTMIRFDNKLLASKPWHNEFASHDFPTPKPIGSLRRAPNNRLIGRRKPKAGKEKNLVASKETPILEPEAMC
jgi:hypothetical protein